MESHKLRWYEDIPTLMAETDKLYDRIVQKWPEKDKLSMTAKMVVEERVWNPSLHLIRKNLPAVLAEHEIFFVPKIMQPGACFVFPLHDIDGTCSYAQTKPLEGSELGTKSKYHFMGIKPIGPVWLGASSQMAWRILHSRSVVVVEGAFDFLACRALSPNTPVLCPLTKKLGKDHIVYLRILGLKHLYLMYDNERSGRGNQAMEFEEKTLATWFHTESLLCPAPDPSDALKSCTIAERLRSMLRRVVAPDVPDDYRQSPDPAPHE
jgi:hypothetical protein